MVSKQTLRSTSQASHARPIIDLCKSRLYLVKPTTQMCSTAYCDQNSRNLSPSTVACTSTSEHKLQPSSHAQPRILNSLIGFWSHAPPYRTCCPPIYKTREISPLPMKHVPPHSNHWLHVPLGSHTRHTHGKISVDVFMMSFDDVTQSMLAATQALEHVSDTSSDDISNIAAQFVARIEIDSETRIQPGSRWPMHYCLTIDFDYPLTADFDFNFNFMRWPLTKSQNFLNCLFFLVFCVDSDFGLYFFIWSSEIDQLAHSSPWFLQRHSLKHLLGIFSYLSNLKVSSSFYI